ncbi:MAG: DUF4345 family protein [Rhizobiaceae bacterium]|nr:DUF4345 family protein [Rhizobiaceae bacterium]
MEFAFPWPVTNGEWGAFASAAAATLLGLALLFAPRISMRMLGLSTAESRPEATAEIRATMASFHLGLGLCCLLLGNQPFLYLALGFCWLFAAFGRLVSILSDRGFTARNLIVLVLELALAAAPLGVALGYVA